MDFNLKTYKHFKIKYYLKKKKFLFFFHGTSLKTKSWISVEQVLVSYKLTYFRILNELMIHTLKNSIFKNLVILIHGPIFLLNSNSIKLTYNKLENVSSFISLLGIRLNHKIYSKKQIQNLKKMSYLENFLILHHSIKNFTKMPYYTLKKKY